MSSIPPPPPPVPPTPPQSPYYPPQARGGGGGGGGFALQQVSGPAVGLLVTGIIGGLWSVVGLLMNLFTTGMSGMMAEDMPEQWMRLFSGTIGIVSAGIGLVVAGILIYASQQMKMLTRWELCVAASVIGMVPCVSPCCLIGLPIGIWALVILMKPEVKSEFR